MSTRATIHFKYQRDSHSTAIIYRHSDGYPQGLGNDLLRFVAEVSKLQDKRFSDPSYLAAKWVVFDAGEYAANEAKWGNKPVNPLAFLSVGIVDRDPGDIEYRYHVICDGKPTITCETAEGVKVSMPDLQV